MSLHKLAFDGNASGLRAVLAFQPAQSNSLCAERGSSLLYTAARWGRLDVCTVLLTEFTTDVNLPNRDNLSTPLHGAAYGGHPEIVTLLLKHGALRDVKNAYGETPLDNAKQPADSVKKPVIKKTIEALTAIAVPVAVPAYAPPTIVSVPTVPAVVAVTPVDYSSMTVGKLRELLVAKSLSTCGTKADLIARLNGTEVTAPPATASPVKVTPVEVAVVAPLATEEPASKKTIVEVSGLPTPVASTVALAAAIPKVSDPAWIARLSAATYTETEVPLNTQEFWDLEEKVNAWYQGRNDDYVSNRLKKKKKPLTFVLKRAWKIHNPVLEEGFAATRKFMMQTLEESQCRVRVAFHGTREANIPSILRTGLLRFKHPLNPCKTQADDGYFGTNQKGVYVSRYYDYTLKYCNGLNPLDEGDVAKTLMFKCLPGKVCPIAKLSMGIEPTPGYNSHSSPNNLEWYVFDESQLCPEYIIEMRAHVDTRTAADDE